MKKLVAKFLIIELLILCVVSVSTTAIDTLLRHEVLTEVISNNFLVTAVNNGLIALSLVGFAGGIIAAIVALVSFGERIERKRY